MIIAIDVGSPGPREAEHVLDEALGLLPGDLGAPQSACTHLVADGGWHHALTIAWDGGPARVALTGAVGASADLADAGVVVRAGPDDDPWVATTHGRPQRVAGALAALEERSRLAGGRLVRFPGQQNLVGRVSVVDLVASSAVDDVEGLAGVVVRHDSVVDTLGWVRPTWRSGRVVLLVQEAPGGGLVPFEVQEQVACCARH